MELKGAQLLVVHGGAAHRDDLLTACVLLAGNDRLPVERRSPSESELSDPGVIVADVGLRYEPDLNNYDHHQFPPDSEPSCALTLVLKAMGLELMAREAWPWLSFTELLDVRGPTTAAKELGVPVNVLRATASPVERAILLDFSSAGRITPDMPLHVQLCRLGKAIMSDLNSIIERLEVLEHKATGLMLNGLEGLDLRAIAPEPLRAVELYCRRSAPDVAILIARDERGSGWTLWRRNDHPRVDFRRLHGRPGVAFIHQTGFMAVLDGDADPQALAAGGIGDEDEQSKRYSGSP